MQDFTKQQNISPKGNILEKDDKSSAAMPGIQHKGWLTKDRFWTLFWGVGLVVGVNIPKYLTGGYVLSNLPITHPAQITLWSSLLLVPFVTWLTNRTKFKDDKVFNSENTLINTDNKPSFLLWQVLAVFLCIIFGLLTDTYLKHLSSNIFLPIVSSIFFLIPITPFLIKNCPVSIIFNYKLWKFEPYESSKSNRDGSNYISDPFYSNMSGNIYNHTHKHD